MGLSVPMLHNSRAIPSHRYNLCESLHPPGNWSVPNLWELVGGNMNSVLDKQEDRKAVPCPQELSEGRCRFPEIRAGEVSLDLTWQAACRMV